MSILGGFRGIALGENVAYIASTWNGIQVVSTEGRTWRPIPVGSLNWGIGTPKAVAGAVPLQGPEGLCMNGVVAYVADFSLGVAVIA